MRLGWGWCPAKPSADGTAAAEGFTATIAVVIIGATALPATNSSRSFSASLLTGKTLMSPLMISPTSGTVLCSSLVREKSCVFGGKRFSFGESSCFYLLLLCYFAANLYYLVG